jgi:hypothetical protein
MRWELCCVGSCTIIQIILILSALYAYQVNDRRAPDDPKKRYYSPYAPWLTPISLPLFVLVNLFLFILSSLAFGIFLVLFPLALLLFRKPFLIKWIRKQALKIGNLALIINTELLRAAGFHPTPIRLQYEQTTSP